jgi:starch synthase (maltosyl-transferring)
VRSYLNRGHVVIERLQPEVDCGRYRAKAVLGDEITVSADIVRDGPALLSAVVRYRGPGDSRWREAPMSFVDDDRYTGTFTPDRIGRWSYTVESWTDAFGTWRRDLAKRVEAGQAVDLELEEGAALLERSLRSIPARSRKTVEQALTAIRSPSRRGKGFDDPRVEAVLDPKVAALMSKHQQRHGSFVYKPALELTVDRERARFGAWYEFFPRSTGSKGKHGTFETAVKELPRIAELGFDVVYLPPIHPIGKTNRKGRNNTLVPEKGDPGVPWAIGSQEGGHDAVHPALGTMDDFDRFVKEADSLGLEVALDLAIQCSPDHPWVEQHPEWFHHRPDGTIKFAENPPKKYEDIYPVNFDTDNAAELWAELKRVVEVWIDHGVKIFRVDNPHTKPFAFWEWLIEEIHSEHPEIIFLSEAFTRPKVMKALAKLGFTQSYTYFTWRNTKQELIEYLTELAHTESADYFRPNFFANTPDILHEFLQVGGPPAFKIRLVLAALMSPSYGIYSGYELFENTPREKGSEEYLHSEKYEVKHRDYNRSPNLNDYIARINQIRRGYPVLQHLTNLRFHPIDKDRMIAFSKTLPGHDPILVIVNLNPFSWEEATVHLDLDALGVDPYRSFEVRDLISGDTYSWRGPHNYVRLDPRKEPAHVFHVRG